MGILSLSDERHIQLKRIRRHAWMAIALCAAFRLADAALGLGIIEPSQSLAAQEFSVCAAQQDFSL
jgi:hypothetical protein